MSKKLIPLMTVLIVLLAGSVLAGDMTYEAYGKLHMSAQLNNDSENSQLSLSSNTSRFGLRGYTPVADNYKLIWQFEQGMDLANRGGTLATRNSYLGFKGTWGTWLVGVHDTPFKTLGRKVTFFKDTVGDFRSTTMGTDRRLSDIIMYKTPKMENFMAQAMYRFDQNAAGADEAANTMSVMAAYMTEQIMIGAAFETDTKGNFGVDAESASGIRAAGKYMGDQFGVSALFQTISNAGGVDELSAQTFGGEVLFKASPDYHLKGSYYMADPNTDADDDEYSQVAFGVDRVYETVTIYLQFAMMMNGDGAAQGLGSNGWGDSVSAFAAGESPYSVSAGFWTTF